MSNIKTMLMSSEMSMLNNVAEKCQLSIIVPVYNVEKYVHACIESIYH